MIEIVESIAMVLIMVPVMVAVLLGAIYGLGEVFNLISNVGKKKHDRAANTATAQPKPAELANK
ncbi:AcrZ family multidrug efflux pump-associated protein [Serratia sp. NPDC078593]|uniref:AcrZ family multidrug efflux pump-associated protein n=1 Tax=unclassified Serratia (in: enterobacteria) TaxID=2647522 RepID=UPI0037D4F1C5